MKVPGERTSLENTGTARELPRCIGCDRCRFDSQPSIWTAHSSGIERIEAVVESIGRSEEAAAFESLDIRDMDAMTAARNTIAGWFRPFATDVLLRHVRDLSLAPGTEDAFDLLRSHHVTTATLSLTWKPAVDWFAQKLGADFAVGTSHLDEGIEHVWPEDKGRWLQDFATQHGLHQGQVAAVGDSEGDREMLAAATFRIFVGDQAPDIPNVLHMPGADMYEVAKRIIQQP
jgi:phosphoserine phosphatase